MNRSSLLHEFQSYECENPSCGLRFANDLSVAHFEHCPRCGSRMIKTGEPYTNFQRPAVKNILDDHKLQLILDNLRSAQNVGSIFRTANGAGVSHVYCCGTTPTPDHQGVRKASLGAEEQTTWSYHPNCLELARTLRKNNYYLCALESTVESISLLTHPLEAISQQNIALILGNEVSGIDPQVLKLVDSLVHIPMAGVKTSLNVAVAAGIGLYWLIDRLNSSKER